MTSNYLFLNLPFLPSTDQNFGNRLYRNPLRLFQNHTSFQSRRISFPIRAVTAMEAEQSGGTASVQSGSAESMKLLFVEMGVGYDQHGCGFLYLDSFGVSDLRNDELIAYRQDVTAAAMRACRDAISSNSIPAFRRGSIPGVAFDQMKLQIKLGVPRPLQQSLDIEQVKSVFPYGKIIRFEVVDGGLICSSGVYVEEMGDKNDDCYIVNAAVYVGY